MRFFKKRTFPVNPVSKGSWLGVRHIQYVMLFVVVNICYAVRSILSIAIFAMTAEDPPDKSIPTYPEWVPYKNIMLSSFFWGYICLQIVAGILIKRYGPKWFLGGAIFIGCLFCCLIPLLGARMGYGGVIFCRIVTGLTQGFLFPSIHCLLSSWTPLQDRAKFGTFVYAGGPLGNVISMPIAGFISNSHLGWPAVFYLFGALGIVWSVVWFIIGSDSPSKHKSISEEEVQYIEQNTEPRDKEEKVEPTPWKAILTSMPVWAILVSHCGQNFGFWTLLTEIPSYMHQILNFDLKSNSTLSSLPYLTNWILSLFMSPIADFIIIKKYANVGQSRKIFNTIGLWIPALALISLTFVDSDNRVAAIILLTIAVGFNSAVYSGYNVNHLDISPVHAGTLMALTNSVSNIFSLISPLVVDAIIAITGYQENQKQLWTFVFCIAAGIYILCGCFYDLFASGEVQSWNTSGTSSVDPESQKPEKQQEAEVFEDIQLGKVENGI
ncbi:putative inorganic phosphate cotransporter isoform X2 [Diabrotica virgifera virgifera]|uniref:Putative inorganic phosphate cotransporter n=1 Tax=Diabrotica virgifera virgifera TaxID=50390 RepID=A0A6P7G115_DIAVI|nr:putative inorganic phosphate cotransporter isoform X2 [Diabrotica virgifera virgifera]